METAYKCPECAGTGYVYREIPSPEVYGDTFIPEFAVACPKCNGGHLQNVDRAKRMAKIPHSYSDKRINDFKWSFYPDDTNGKANLINDFISNYRDWESNGLGLYIWSHTRGSGKTFLASCICNELIDKYYPMNTCFVSATKLIDLDKASNTDENNNIQQLCNCQLLVIDDLGQKATGQQWQEDILFRILDHRVSNNLITIITSNYQIGELELDIRIVDRIYQVCQLLQLPECAVRQKEATERKKDFLKKRGLIA